MQAIIAFVIDQLCQAFDRGGYNPTPIIDIGILVAGADGEVDERERSMLLEVFQALLNTHLTPEIVDHLITASMDVIATAGAESRARHVAAILHDCDAVEPGVRIALTIALASKGLSPAEFKVIERIATAGGMTPTRLAQIVKDVRAHAAPDPASVRELIAPSSRRLV